MSELLNARWLTSIGLGALGFLPAVVVHSVLRGEHHHMWSRLPGEFTAAVDPKEQRSA